MFKKKEIPVYLFFGFLESGKTSFIQETMNEGQFKDGIKTVYIMCEEGIEEIGEKDLQANRFSTVSLEDESEVTEERFLKIDKELKPDRVVIEYNGMWNQDTVLEALPEHWVVAEGIATVDASTYADHLNNMKMLMLNQFTYTDLILFNRCTDEMVSSGVLAGFKRTARAKNRRAQVIFEMSDGTINNNIKEELPYDLNSPLIEIEDDDFGIWYIDSFEHMDAYIGKRVRFKGQVYFPKKSSKDVFVPGRFAMTCCAADIQFVGFQCRYDKRDELKEKEYVTVTATVRAANMPGVEGPVPFLIADGVEKTAPPVEEVVMFN
ncbi:MAG: GTPase [Lachnospiraceae bacterium]|nr:GTPase [Lachnospiraceae bacterium]